jgi:hypothetical protein
MLTIEIPSGASSMTPHGRRTHQARRSKDLSEVFGDNAHRRLASLSVGAAKLGFELALMTDVVEADRRKLAIHAVASTPRTGACV